VVCGSFVGVYDRLVVLVGFWVFCEFCGFWMFLVVFRAVCCVSLVFGAWCISAYFAYFEGFSGISWCLGLV